MSEKIIRFGILGCGTIAGFHADAIASLKEAELVGVADVTQSLAMRFAESRNVKAYPDYQAMLADPRIDAVCICTPSGFHAENALQALKAKKHVVLEKPMALTKQQAWELDAEAQKSNSVLTVISQLRFSKDIRRVKALLEQNALGQLVLCDLYMKYWRDPEYYASSNWKGTRRFDGGGALMNQGIHGVDIMLYLAGEAKVVYAKSRTCFHKIEVEDCAVATLEFANGAMGVVEGTTCSNPGFDRRIEITGTKGSVVIVEDQIEKLIVDGQVLVEGIQEFSLDSAASDPTAMDYKPHAMQIANFIGAIHGREKLAVTTKDGAMAVSLIEEIYNFGQ